MGVRRSFVWAAALCGAVLSSCGSRTGLRAPCVARIETIPTDMMFVIDRSDSMRVQTSDRLTPWTQLVQTMDRMLPQLDGIARVGLVMFPAENLQTEAEACRTSERVDVPMLADWRPTRDAIRAAVPSGGTPTFEGLSAGYRALGARALDRRRIVVLVTDGGAACNPALDPSTCVCALNPATLCSALGDSARSACLDFERIVTLANAQREEGVETSVVGLIAEEQFDRTTASRVREFLDQLARAGGTDRFYRADNATQLTAELSNNVLPAMYCRLHVHGPVREEHVFASGTERVAFARPPASGWSWRSRDHREVQLQGDACTQAIARRVTEWRATVVDQCYSE